MELSKGGGGERRKDSSESLHKMCSYESHPFTSVFSTYSSGSSASISISTWGRDAVCHVPTHSGGNLTLQYTSETGTMHESQATWGELAYN